MKIGVSSYAFRWSIGTEDFTPSVPLTPQTLLEKSVACGAQVVQICENMPLDGVSNPDLAVLRQTALDLGLGLELGVRGSDRSYLLRNVQVCHQIGSRLMRVVLDGANPLSQMIETVQSLLGELRAHNVRLAIENHFLSTPADLAQMIKAIDDVHVGACLDPLNSISQLIGPSEVISTLAPYALCVHAKDAVTVRRGTGFCICGCPLGQGLIDYQGMICMLRDQGSDPSILVECWMDQQENETKTVVQEEDWVCEGVAYLRSIL
ncbi:MAG: sugar phosphate isomerase/epimerase family protein [Planctomycetota bacterium]|jgi:sugar phosphate isomerase/epimerase